jgi:hypothetical protein
MISRSTFHWMLIVGVASLAAACEAPKATPGQDPGTRSNATTVSWSDGKPAYSITCDIPGGCNTRAIAMCPKGYTVLKTENMPTTGTYYAVLGPPSVVIRCG